jgi:peptidoglycan/xylan/chitin deacetylase (PgdA/CDA1 family)
MLRLPALLALLLAAPLAAQAPPRAIAVTIDDLPLGRRLDLQVARRTTDGLLEIIQATGIPVTGFVNEGKLEGPGGRVAWTQLLHQWVDAGVDLGNHTYSHFSLFNTPLAQFQENVLRGSVVTNALLSARGDSIRYFRHPYLNTGPDAETKAAFEAWLSEIGYRVAPVTHDNAEYIYAHAYDIALERQDHALARRVADAYIAYMDSTAGYYETLSRELFGREPAQVLLIHANALNSARLDDLLAMYERRGYAFVSLDAALEDPAYASADTYTGRAGMSWLQRWAITRGVRLTSEPVPDAWVVALTEAAR